MDSQQRKFQYDPLPESRSFRLIKELAFDVAGCHLSCVLESFSLDNCPLYRCLSYTWGPALTTDAEHGEHTDTTKAELIVKAEEAAGVLSINENLSDALSQLAESFSLGSTRYMWIDAICIDQENLEERSSQVSRMDSIYSGAEKVIVWLGKDMTDFTNFAWFHNDALASEYLQGSQADSILKRTNAEAPIFQGAYSNEPGIVEKWVSYGRFFEQRRWFNRAWVVQEVVMARPSDIEVICGNKSLSWINMVAFALGVRLSGLGANLQPTDNRVKHVPTGDQVVRLGVLQELCERGGPDQESSGGNVMTMKEFLIRIFGVTDSEARRHAFLHHVLNVIRPFDSLDPRDKVYAALGIVNRFLPRGSRSIIYPEYDSPVREVYEYTTKFLLEHLPYHCVLTLVEDPSRRTIVNLPSWVPDFSSQQGNSCLQLTSRRPYNASAGKSSAPSWFLKDSILSVRASCHDTVAQTGIYISTLGEGPPSHFQFLLDILTIIDDALKLCSTLDPTYINGQSRIQALGRTIIADQDSWPADFLHRFRCWLFWHLVEMPDSRIERVTNLLKSIVLRMVLLNESALSEEDFLSAPQNLAHYATQDGAKPEQRTMELYATIEEITEKSDAFSRYFSSVYPHRRLYTTSKGFIGLGPLSTQVGDEVWIICDAKTPFILHPRPDNSSVLGNSDRVEEVKQFQLVGETYLHGFMNGKALRPGLPDQLRWIDLI